MTDHPTSQAPTAAPVEEPKVTNITIQGMEFEVDLPYKPGAIELTAGEAAALNQTRAENLRNNFASKIKSTAAEIRKANNMAEDAEVPPSMFDKDALDKEFAEYAKDYEFGVRSIGGTRAPVDPVEREAQKIALAKVKEALSKSGVKVTSVSKEKMDEMVKAVIAKYPQITEEAKRRVESVGEIVIGDLAA